MGFADELRNAPNKKQQEEQRQLKQDWQKLVELLIDDIKSYCRYVAEAGRNECTIYLRDCVERIEDTCASKYVDEYGSDKIVEMEFFNTDAGKMWMRMRNKFFHYICEEQAYSMPYPNMMGLSKKDAQTLAAELKEQLLKEDLHVEVGFRKEYERVHYEDKYVQHTSKLEQILTGTAGHYEKQEAVDEQMYSFYLQISW